MLRQIKISHQITSRDSLALEKYLQEISRISVLTPEEEVELSVKIHEGDEDALASLVRANLRFVVSVAKQYANSGVSLIDLINEGSVGLIKAAKRLDHTKGFKFISYAVWWIRQQIMLAMTDSRLIRLPQNKSEASSRLNKVQNVFMQREEREPNMSELAEMAEMKLEDVENILRHSIKMVSLDAPDNHNDEESSALINRIGDDANTTDDELITDSLRTEIQDVLRVLSHREVEIIERYYGLNGITQMSLEDIADDLDLTRERVRQIKEKALRRLRKSAKSTILKNYL
ncbi:MAG: sigma-70 family RNA polymerase sigma factor [Sphingobacteriales bacterium]|nr:sigma-70 family RNA polymerase sigma factor [Sphingobacteriales bacterium]